MRKLLLGAVALLTIIACQKDFSDETTEIDLGLDDVEITASSEEVDRYLNSGIDPMELPPEDLIIPSKTDAKWVYEVALDESGKRIKVEDVKSEVPDQFEFDFEEFKKELNTAAKSNAKLYTDFTLRWDRLPYDPKTDDLTPIPYGEQQEIHDRWRKINKENDFTTVGADARRIWGDKIDAGVYNEPTSYPWWPEARFWDRYVQSFIRDAVSWGWVGAGDKGFAQRVEGLKNKDGYFNIYLTNIGKEYVVAQAWPGGIEYDWYWYTQQTPTERWATMYHELGHALLDIPHHNYSTIMNALLPQYGDHTTHFLDAKWKMFRVEHERAWRGRSDIRSGELEQMTLPLGYSNGTYRQGTSNNFVKPIFILPNCNQNPLDFEGPVIVQDDSWTYLTYRGTSFGVGGELEWHVRSQYGWGAVERQPGEWKTSVQFVNVKWKDLTIRPSIRWQTGAEINGIPIDDYTFVGRVRNQCLPHRRVLDTNHIKPRTVEDRYTICQGSNTNFKQIHPESWTDDTYSYMRRTGTIKEHNETVTWEIPYELRAVETIETEVNGKMIPTLRWPKDAINDDTGEYISDLTFTMYIRGECIPNGVGHRTYVPSALGAELPDPLCTFTPTNIDALTPTVWNDDTHNYLAFKGTVDEEEDFEWEVYDEGNEPPYIILPNEDSYIARNVEIIQTEIDGEMRSAIKWPKSLRHQTFYQDLFNDHRVYVRLKSECGTDYHYRDVVPNHYGARPSRFY